LEIKVTKDLKTISRRRFLSTTVIGLAVSPFVQNVSLARWKKSGHPSHFALRDMGVLTLFTYRVL
jgi:hypothetical protein